MPVRTRFAPIDFKTRFPALDGIRALAVTMVFLNHYGGGSHGGLLLRVVNEVRQRLWTGVDLFFVLSGFLITGILYDTRNDSHFFKRFFARRSLRIFPVFYLVAVVLVCLTPIFRYQWRLGHLSFLLYMGNWFGNRDFSLYDLLATRYLTGKIFIGHFWSLCVEEQFYLLWPPLVWLIRDRVKLIRLTVVLSVLAFLLRCVWCYTQADPNRWIVRTLPFRMDTLLLGGTLALLLRGPSADAWQRACKWIFLGALAAAVPIFSFGYKDSEGPLLLTLGLTLSAIASAGLIGMTLVQGSPAFRLFSLRPLRVLGKYSYGFYIFHALWVWAWIMLLVRFSELFHSMMIAGLVTLPLNFLVTFVVSKLSYDLFEVKFLRWKRHFEYDSELEQHKHAFTTK